MVWLKNKSWDEYRMPDKEWFERAKNRSEFTPDYWRLSQHEFQNIFVYNEWMENRRENDLLKLHGTKLGGAFTKDSSFILWKRDVGRISFPIGMRSKENGTWFKTSSPDPNWRYSAGKIRGECWTIRTYQFKQLDRYMANTVQFQRTRVDLVVPYKVNYWNKEFGSVVSEERTFIARDVWMYIGIEDYWDKLLDGGFSYCLVRRFEAPVERLMTRGYLGEYYYFSAMEDRVESNSK